MPQTDRIAATRPATLGPRPRQARRSVPRGGAAGLVAAALSLACWVAVVVAIHWLATTARLD